LGLFVASPKKKKTSVYRFGGKIKRWWVVVMVGDGSSLTFSLSKTLTVIIRAEFNEEEGIKKKALNLHVLFLFFKYFVAGKGLYNDWS
jgi:hypothetical protein